MDTTQSAILTLLSQNISAQNFSTTTQWVSIAVLGVTAIILAITGWFVYKYTKATLDLRDTARNEIELTMLPLLVFEFGVEDRSNYFMKIRNMGKGPALNVKISPFKFISGSIVYESNFLLEEYNIVDPNVSKRLKEKVLINNEEARGHSLIPYLHPRFAEDNHEFTIKFDNSLGIAYKTVIKTGKAGISIIKPPKH